MIPFVKKRRQLKIEAQPIEELNKNDIGKEITLVDVNGEMFTGIFGKMVDNNIILKEPGNTISLGFPLEGLLCYFYGNLEQQRQLQYKTKNDDNTH